MIPRVGLRMQLPDLFTRLEYYGRGPWENYIDRRTSCFIGRYEANIADLYEPYVRPQENNHRTDVSWFALTGKKERFANRRRQFVGIQCFELSPRIVR